MGRALLGWLSLAWASALLVAAVALFGSGFLLTRLELSQRSTCAPPPPSPRGGSASGPLSCWTPRRRFARAVLVLIDALRFDFAAFRPGLSSPRPFQNRLPTLRRLSGRHGRLYRFRADPPTTTMQRLKALVTGGLPTFVDAGRNFASHAVQEDSLLAQLSRNGRRTVFLGDDTWKGLFPHSFSRARFFPSFNVKDLHSVDDAILEDLYGTVDGAEWDLLIAHFLGVDHCGHRYGPDHPEMAKKLSQMDDMLRSLVDHLENDTLLLVAGDHGMTRTGDHGGDSEDEVNAALFVYSKVPLFHSDPPEEPETVPQVNLAPTLALLLGVPVPYSSIGEVMADLFALEGDSAASVLAQLEAYNVNARQVNRFLQTYAMAAQDIPSEKLHRLRDLFALAVEEHERLLAQVEPPALPQLEHLQGQFRHYLQEARAVCAESWARFRPVRMVAGCALLMSSCLLCYVAATVVSDLNFSYQHLLFYPVLWGLAGAALLALACHLNGWAGMDFLLFFSCATAASQCGFFWHCWTRRLRRKSEAVGAFPPSGSTSLRRRLWAGLGPALPWGILLARCGAMHSDSFVMAEARVAPFLLTSLVLLMVLMLQWEGMLEGPLLFSPLLWTLGILLVCTRLSEQFWQCREETPCCRSSPALAPLSSLQDPRAKNFYYMMCMTVVVGLVYGTRCWLRHYGNLNSPSVLVLFVRWGFPVLAVCIGCYWAISSGAEEAVVKHYEWVQLALVAFPRGIFLLVIVGLLLVLWNPVTVFVKDSREPVMTGAPIVSPSSQAELLHVIPQLYRKMQETLKIQLDEARSGDGGATVAAYGLGSVYSAAMLISLSLMGFLLVTLHSERLSLAFLMLFLEAFALLWVHTCVRALSPQSDPFTVPWSALFAWSLAATQFFYATGHQPVFPAIHWRAAFVGFQEGHETHLLPALLVGANTFASHILFSAACPLLLLWPFVCEGSASRSRKAKLEAPDKEEQMMEMRLREVPERFSAALLQLGFRYLLVLGVQMLSCVVAAMILRRHLMVWKVFAPKFLFEALGFVVSSVFLLLGIGLVMRVDSAVSLWFKKVILAQRT